MDPETLTFYCSQCKSDCPKGLKAFQRHLKRSDHTPPYVCGQTGCNNQYMLRPSLYEHIRFHHCRLTAVARSQAHADVHQDLDINVGAVDDHSGGEAGGAAFEHHGGPGFEELIQQQQQVEHPEVREELFPAPVNLQRSAESCILNLRSINYMTGVAIQNVQEQCFIMMQDTASYLRGKVMDFFSNPGRSHDELEDLLRDFSLCDPFQHIRHKKQQMKCFELKYGMLKPEEIYLDPRFDSRQHPQRPRLQPTQVPNSFQYVSIIEIIKCVMLDPKLRNLILTEQASQDEYMRSFLDGLMFQSLPPDLKKAVRIVLYIDDLELVQALSAQKNIYKIAGIYFGIQNLPAELNALLTYIFVTCVAYAEDAKDSEVWKPFLADMKKLETEGVEIIVDGEPFIIKAVLVAQIGDTLAAHEVLGLMTPSASSFCRLCYIKRKDMWQDGTTLGAPRTPDSHLRDVIAAIAGNIRLQRASGVRGLCLIRGLVVFNPVKSSVFDIFHDLLQGIFKMEVKLALREYVCIKKYFTVEDLNSRVQFFDYGFTDKKNKPTANFTYEYLNNIKSYNLPQTGSQMWCFTRAFGFLFGDLVPEDDKFIKLIGLLNQISSIVFSRAISDHDIKNLEDLIQAHHRLFVDIFPQTQDEATDDEVREEETFQDIFETENVDEELHRIDEESCDDPAETNEDSSQPSTSQSAAQDTRRRKRKKKVVRMINKHHHMLHYAELIRLFGPLILYCCIRQEARHYFFKLAATICHNYINVLKTLMEMFQMKIAADRSLQRDNRVVMAKRGTKLLSVFDTPHSHQLADAGVVTFSKVYAVKFVTFDKIDYRPGLFVTLKNQTRGTFPIFAQIKDIYVSQNEESLYLMTQEWKTINFDSKMCAFKVSQQSRAPIILKQPAEISSYRLLAAWKRYDSDQTYLAPRTIA